MCSVIVLSDLFDATCRMVTLRGKDELTVPIGFIGDFNRATNRAEFLAVYSVWAKRIVTVDRCSVALHTEDCTLALTALTDVEGIPQGTHTPVAGTLIDAVFERPSLLYLPDLKQRDLPDPKLLKDLGYTSVMLAPISAGAIHFGALNASFGMPPAMPAANLASLQAIARCLATQLLVRWDGCRPPQTASQCAKMMV